MAKRKYFTILTNDSLVDIFYEHYTQAKQLSADAAGAENRRAYIDLIEGIGGSAKATLSYCRRQEKIGAASPLSDRSMEKMQAIQRDFGRLSKGLAYLKAQQELIDILLQKPSGEAVPGNAPRNAPEALGERLTGLDV